MDKEIESIIAAVKAELKTECAAWIEALQAELAEAKSACWNRCDFLAKRTKALEARCHELEHGRADNVQSQIADLQERVGALENERSQRKEWLTGHAQLLRERLRTLVEESSREVRYIPVDDHRDKERPAKPAPELVRCSAWETCVAECGERPGHLSHRMPHERTEACSLTCYDGSTCVPVPAQEPVKPAPQMMICSAPCVDRPKCMHLHPHVESGACLKSSCGPHGVSCQPVPAEPEVAIPDLITLDSMAHMEPEPDPDVPTSVGTEAFRERLAGHMQELSGGYCWSAERLAEGIPSDYLERLAGVACTLRDAYELARSGEHEAAEEKLREIEW